MPTGTVTATQGGSTSVGMAIAVAAVTGQAGSPIGISQGATNTTPSLATGTGVTTGSLVYFSNLALTGTWTPNGATTKRQDVNAGGLEYISGRSTSTMTGGVSATIGGTSTANSISITLLEILNGTGLADTAVQSGFSSTTTLASPSITAANLSLVVVMVSSNGGASVTTMSMTDTLGGLTWTERVKQNTAGDGYTGIWTAPVPAAAAGGGMLLGSDT